MLTRAAQLASDELSDLDRSSPLEMWLDASQRLSERANELWRCCGNSTEQVAATEARWILWAECPYDLEEEL